jgi:glucan phosphoethanolaminetransferase (alkaline phosphatase superfamily)
LVNNWWVFNYDITCYLNLKDSSCSSFYRIIPPVFILAGIGLYSFYRWCSLKIPYQKRKNISIIILVNFLIIFIVNYNNYFQKWAKNPNVSSAFNENYKQIENILFPPFIIK